MPTPWDGKNLWNGKKNPVTLVATVLVKKRAVQPSDIFAPSSSNPTTNPEMIPTRLIATWTKVSVVIPKIMMCLLSGSEDITIRWRNFPHIAADVDTCGPSERDGF